MKRRLLHYSAKPLQFDPARKYPDDDHWKPRGLWLSVEGEQDWREWCESESFGDLTHASEAKLIANPNVLIIDTIGKLDDFNKQYGGDDDRTRSISWRPVKAAYDGIIIAPYRWERRLDLMWYYGWDCASGVIWNLRAIASVVPVVDHVLKEIA